MFGKDIFVSCQGATINKGKNNWILPIVLVQQRTDLSMCHQKVIMLVQNLPAQNLVKDDKIWIDCMMKAHES